MVSGHSENPTGACDNELDVWGEYVVKVKAGKSQQSSQLWWTG